MNKSLLAEPTIGSKGGVIGRPPKEPPSDAAELIRTLAGSGASIVGIAASLGVSRVTFNRWLADDEALQGAFDVGREKERTDLHTRLYTIAMHGKDERNSAIAAMFLLKSRHGYREGVEFDPGNKINVVFNLPGPMSLADFRKVVSTT